MRRNFKTSVNLWDNLADAYKNFLAFNAAVWFIQVLFISGRVLDHIRVTFGVFSSSRKFAFSEKNTSEQVPVDFIQEFVLISLNDEDLKTHPDENGFF